MTALLATGLFLAFATSTAWASPNCSSDNRASAKYGGNPRSCTALGHRGDSYVGSQSGRGTSDPYVLGTVTVNSGLTQSGTGQEVDLDARGPSSIVVDAVVVGGPDAYNTYRGYRFLPRYQHSIPPYDTHHRLPPVSYWFACYHHSDPGSSLPEVPRALDVPLAAGGLFAVFLVVQHRRRKVATTS